MRYKLIALICCFTTIVFAQQSQPKSLIPDTHSKAPDYLCTWNLQGYVVSHENTELSRGAMTEENIFGTGRYQNWIECFPTIREDLYFVLDDSWDIPEDANKKNPNKYLGLVELNEERFSSFQGNATERLKHFSDRVKSKGWKGAGGWICAQKSELHPDVSEVDYWTERIKAADAAGFDYWKVDWGNNARNKEWRMMLTGIGKKHAPRLFIEHAMTNEFIEFSDVFRTYDVENVIAQPVTIQRICDLLPYTANEGAKGIINCEDEPYIAAGLGCAIGIMRFPFPGAMPDGTPDIAFPEAGRNIKKRLDEVVRGVRWHRIAEPFAVDGSFVADTVRLHDYWILGDRETWVKSRKKGDKLTADAPARVSRGMALPEISGFGEDRPFVLASKYPNGAIAVAAIGRALGREYVSKEISVTVQVDSKDVPIGLFGCFQEITLVFPSKIDAKNQNIYAQDLAGDIPVDITKQVVFKGNRLTIPGSVIRQVGLMNASEGDLSDPGLVVRIRVKN